MKKLVNVLIFRVGIEVLASLDVENDTILDVENFKNILAIQYNIAPDDIEALYETKELSEPIGESFISVTGKLCFHNERWDAEIIEGFSFVDWLDVTTEEGINTLSDYKYLGKADELVKFN